VCIVGIIRDLVFGFFAVGRYCFVVGFGVFGVLWFFGVFLVFVGSLRCLGLV